MSFSQKLMLVNSLEDGQALFESEVRRLSRTALYRDSKEDFEDKTLSIMNAIHGRFFEIDVVGSVVLYDDLTYEYLCLSKRARKWKDPKKSMKEYRSDVRFFVGLFIGLLLHFIGLTLMSKFF